MISGTAANRVMTAGAMTRARLVNRVMTVVAMTPARAANRAMTAVAMIPAGDANRVMTVVVVPAKGNYPDVDGRKRAALPSMSPGCGDRLQPQSGRRAISS